MAAFKKTIALLISALLIVAPAVFANLTVEQVEGLDGDGRIPDGATLTFHMRMQNDYGAVISAIDNGYWVKSDGMTWGNVLPTASSYNMAALFDAGFFIKEQGDTVGFGGANFFNPAGGLAIGFDQIAYLIEVGPITLGTGSYLTLDSCFYLPSNHWEWTISLGGSFKPDWGGPYTYLPEITCQEPIISPDDLADGVVGTAYSATFEVAGTEPFTYILVDGPAGMEIDPVSGEITWPTPVAGTYGVELTVTNECPGSDTKTLSLEICEPPLITSVAVGDAAVGQLYSYQVVASGYQTPVITLAMEPPPPAGMEITDGLITWTPTAAGTYPIKVEATNSCGTAYQEFNIIVCEPVEITTLTIPDGQVGTAYSATVEETGTGPFTYDFAATPAPPEGLEIDEATGDLSWTEPVAGDYTFEIVVTNDCGDDAQSLSLHVCELAMITTDPATAPDGTVGVPYEFLVEATGYPAPEFFLVTPPPVPDDMEIDQYTGLLTWTPEEPGEYDITVEATNDCGVGDAIAINITVNPAPAAVMITSVAIESAAVNVAYEYDVEATGYPVPEYRLLQKPTGMTIDQATGLIQWTPTASGVYPVEVEAYNDHSDDQQLFNITVCDPATVTTTTLPDGIAGTSYSTVVAATGFPDPTFELTAGPTGMEINLNTGELTWLTPTAGTHAVTVEASNACNTDEAILSLYVCTPAAITTTELPEGLINDPYVAVIVATGDPVLTFDLTAGQVGDMALDPSTGELTWTPAAAGDFDITVEVSNGCGPAATADFTITILEFNEPFCWLEPSPLYLKDLPEERIVEVFIKDPNLKNIDLATVRIQSKIPCYTGDGLARFDTGDPETATMVISDAFVFRFLSTWRPIREENMPDSNCVFNVTYYYDGDPEMVTVDSSFILDWELLALDLNLDGYADQNDIDLLVNYLWKGGSASMWPEMMDVDGNGRVSVSDLRKLLELIQQR